MISQYKKIFFDSYYHQYSYTSFVNSVFEKSECRTNVESMKIEHLQNELFALQFGSYSNSQFFECPIWLNKILCHSLIYNDSKYTFSFSCFENSRLRKYEIPFQLKNGHIDHILNCTLELINLIIDFLNKNFDPISGNKFDFNQCNFSNLFDTSFNSIFIVLKKIEIIKKTEDDFTLKLDLQVSKFLSMYVLMEISSILNMLGFKNSWLDKDFEIDVSFIDRNVPKLEVENLSKENFQESFREVILFFFPIYFNKKLFIMDELMYKENPDLLKALIQATFL